MPKNFLRTAGSRVRMPSLSHFYTAGHKKFRDLLFSRSPEFKSYSHSIVPVGFGVRS